MKAIILAAGRGSRMKEMTDERPKCLVEVHGKPLLRWQTDALTAAGVDEIGIVVGYRSELLEGCGFTVFRNPRWQETNMVASLACAAEWLRDQPCIVSYSDIFYEAAAASSLMHSDAALAVTYDPNWRRLWERRFADPLSDAETFRLGSDGNLLEIGRKPERFEDVEGQYMGLLRFSPPAWAAVDRLRDGLEARVRDRLDMTGMLQRLIESGATPVRALPYVGVWGEVDSPDDIAAYADRGVGNDADPATA